jgi:serine protease
MQISSRELRGGSHEGISDYDPPPPPLDIMSRYGARELDPATAERLANVAPRSTVYIADTLLVSRAVDTHQVLAMLTDVANPLGLDPTVVRLGALDLASEAMAVKMVPRGDVPTRPADAWSALQWARARFGIEAVAGVGLDHVMVANPRVMAVPFQAQVRSSQPQAGATPPPAPDYIHPGGGGRQPVAWLGPQPHRTPTTARRPVVAILDTGCGAHPWLDLVVERDLTIDGTVIGFPSPSPTLDFEVTQSFDDYANAIAGHGTFMAGLVHMFCPDADLIAVRVVDADGVVVESELVYTLAQILELVRRHRAGDPGGRPIDVLVLSIGYYHETPEDSLFAPILSALLESLGRLGVVTVAAAGNDATSRPMFPAALAPWSDGQGPNVVDTESAPVVSVGAMNPDRADALFSNAGPWVRAWEIGASVVSTMPVSYQHQRSSQAMPRQTAFGRVRGALDPDDYRAGFAVWSGTSFAAPVLGGKLATHLRASLGSDGVDNNGADAVRRAWEAVEACTDIRT